MFNVKGQSPNVKTYDYEDTLLAHGVGSVEGVSIKQNFIGEILDGVGISVDASTVLFDQNQVKKCEVGMLLQSSQSYQTSNMLQQIDNFALVTIDMGTVHLNTLAGI